MTDAQEKPGGRSNLAMAIVGIAIGVAGGLGWFWWETRITGADASNPELVAIGRSVYAAHCASCHGTKLQGEPNWETRKPSGMLPAPPHDASGHTWHHSDEQLFGITKHGLQAYAPPGYKTEMPAYKDVLSDKNIWAVLAYIKSTWPENERRHQERINQRSQGK